ncbi:hypothetical protein ACG7TL_005848 [Trametes sanguinea]
MALPGHTAPVEHLAVKDGMLASGAHHELFIWADAKLKGWKPVLDLGTPPKNSQNEAQEVVISSVHWTVSRAGESLLIVTYLHHGIVIFKTSNWTHLRAIPNNGNMSVGWIDAETGD